MLVHTLVINGYLQSGYIFKPVNKICQAILMALSFLVSKQVVFVVKVKFEQN
jgi:hypothetical protein